MNKELENKVMELDEFKNNGWKIKSSNEYSVTLTRINKGNTEELIVYASYMFEPNGGNL